MYAIEYGAATQQSAQTFDTITNHDPANSEQYTVVPAGACSTATWLTVTSAIGGAVSVSANTSVTILAGQYDTLSFVIANNHAPVSLNGCTFTFKWNTAAITTNPVLTFSNLAIMAITATAASTPVSYDKATPAPIQATATTTIAVPAGVANTTFYLDTLPPWLTATGGMTAGTPSTINANSSLQVTFTIVGPIAQGMSTGNYTASVGFYTTSPTSLGLELFVPFTIQISNGDSGVTLVPTSGTTVPVNYPYGAVFVPGSPTLPPPSATLYATDEPIPFTVTCSVTQSPQLYIANPAYAGGCSLNGPTSSSNTASATANGTAFTWGSTVTASLDPNLFLTPATIGYQVTVVFQYANTTLANPQPVATYTYTIVPAQAAFAGTLGSISGLPLQPMFVSATKTDYVTGSSFNVLVRGSNFYSPRDIQGTSIAPTQVFLGATQLSTNSQAGSYVVLDNNDILVTIPASSVPTVATGHTGQILIGLANQTTGGTTPSVPGPTSPLTFTYAPVVYAVTSTASYLQPTLDTTSGNHLGYIPALAPYELISIFGDNFGFNNLAPNSASNTLDGYGKFLSPLTEGTPSGAGAKATTMTVTFKDLTQSTKNTWNAPIVFANQYQINAIVPSGMTSTTAPYLYNVIVSTSVAGAPVVSDGDYQISYVNADPGIFTLASDGVGQGAIINGNGSVNGTTPVASGDQITIYLTGLGAPDSVGGDVIPGSALGVPAGCVGINQTTPANGLMQVVNTKSGSWNPGWTSIDGSVLSYDSHHILEIPAPVPGGEGNWLNYPPCFANPTITVTIGTAANHYQILNAVDGTAGTIPYAGFVGGSVAGLYQINAVLTGLTTNAKWTSSYPGSGLAPISVSITYPTTPNATTYTSPAGPMILLP